MENKISLSVEEYISGRSYLLTKIEPLVGILLTKVDIKENESTNSMGVTSDTLYYNKEFVKTLTQGECLFVLYHELLHLAFLHPLKTAVGNKNPFLYNVACDLLINKYIIDTHFQGGLRSILNKRLTMHDITTKVDGIPLQIPTYTRGTSIGDGLINVSMGNGVGCYDVEKGETTDGGLELNTLVEPWVDIQNMDTNKIYEIINKDYKKSSKIKKDVEDKVSSTPDISLNDLEGLTTEEIIKRLELYEDGAYDLDFSNTDKGNTEEVLKNKIKTSIAESEQIKNSDNKTSGNLLMKISKLLKPTVDWRKIINKKLFDLKSVIDLSYKNIDTRYSYLDLNLPTDCKIDDGMKLNNVTVAVDVSGSISRDEYTMFISETIHLFNKYKADGELIHWDTEITSKGTVMGTNVKKSVLEIKGVGGGGTSPDCIFEYYDKIKKVPPLIVIFTDGYICSSPNKQWANKYKNTVWMVTNNGNKEFSSPIGKVHYM